MAKIGTAHVEIKPVLDEATLEVITARIADAVADGVIRGMSHVNRKVRQTGDASDRELADVLNILAAHGHTPRKEQS